MKSHMKPFTVIVRCLCGCGIYYRYHVSSKTPAAAEKKTLKLTDKQAEIAMVLKGHCEEA